MFFHSHSYRAYTAGLVGFEPTTHRLTADCAAIAPHAISFIIPIVHLLVLRKNNSPSQSAS